MNRILGGAFGKPTLSTKTNKAEAAVLGSFAYIDKDAPAPNGFLAITSTTILPAEAYPDLAKVIPADQVATVEFSTTPQASLPNPSPDASDQFGRAVAISGDYAIVGAYLDSPAGVSNAGSAYIYFRSGTNWNLQATLPNPVTNPGSQFAYSVAISGDYAIVGAPLEDPSGVNNAGSAYIYVRSGTNWTLQATIPNPSPNSSDLFGFSVAISGDYAIVGAYTDDASATADAGSAYIYFRSGTTWSLQATLPNPSPNVADLFGVSVAISGDYAIVGAYLDDPSAVTDAGSAYIYFRSGTNWTLQATLPNPSPNTNDQFGWSVAISGDYAIVGAFQDDPAAVSDAGSAYIYFRSGTNWTLQATLPNPSPNAVDLFGHSVAISGDYAIVGAYGDNPAGVGDAGSAYIYFRSGTTWSLQATLPNPAPDANDQFGRAVAISGAYAIVGAYLDDPAGVTDTGSAYIYARPIEQKIALHPLPTSAEHKTIVKVIP